MKTYRIILLSLVGLLAVFALAGCSGSFVLTQLVQATDSIDQTSETYQNVSITEQDSMTELNYFIDSTTVITLSDTENILVTFNELRLELIEAHETNVGELETLRAYAESIRTSAESLSELGYVLLEEDIQILRDNITQLKSLRSDLLETSGEAYQRIYDLRGTYTRENLPDIIVVYQEVIEVLNERLEIFQNANQIMMQIDQILLE